MDLISDAGLPGFSEAVYWTPNYTATREWVDLTCVFASHGNDTTYGESPLAPSACSRGAIVFCSDPFEAGQDVAR